MCPTLPELDGKRGEAILELMPAPSTGCSPGRRCQARPRSDLSTQSWRLLGRGAPGWDLVVVVLWCLFNHFYRNQPTAQLQPGRARGPNQPLLLPSPSRPLGSSTVSRGSPAQSTHAVSPRTPGRGGQTPSHRCRHHQSPFPLSSSSHFRMSVPGSVRDESHLHCHAHEGKRGWGWGSHHFQPWL